MISGLVLSAARGAQRSVRWWRRFRRHARRRALRRSILSLERSVAFDSDRARALTLRELLDRRELLANQRADVARELSSMDGLLAALPPRAPDAKDLAERRARLRQELRKLDQATQQLDKRVRKARKEAARRK